MGPATIALGERLRRLAASKGIKPKQLADEIGLSVPHLSRLYCGRRRFTPAILDRIIMALQLEHTEESLHKQAAAEYGFRIFNKER